jgi:putative protein kinase ArgK-like GTPase of G3E family
MYAAFRLKQQVSILPEMGKPNVVFVLGGPGAGKGTQCANIVKVGCSHGRVIVKSFY